MASDFNSLARLLGPPLVNMVQKSPTPSPKMINQGPTTVENFNIFRRFADDFLRVLLAIFLWLIAFTDRIEHPLQSV